MRSLFTFIVRLAALTALLAPISAYAETLDDVSSCGADLLNCLGGI